MKIIRVGDPHAKAGCIDEMKKLILFIAEQAKLHAVDRIEILGDLFHTHNIVRLEVIEFWVWAFDILTPICETVVLVGNHDLSGDYNSNFSVLTVFAMMNKKNLLIVDKPTLLGTYAYIPYTHNADSFICAANRLADEGATVLVCHQTIEGSKYESGIYAPDGIPAAEWSERFVHVISGHIHSEQSFGNVLYPGTARWDTVTDANRRKGIWFYTHRDHDTKSEDAKSARPKRSLRIHDAPSLTDGSGDAPNTEKFGTILSAQFISTEHVCSPIRSIEWREGEPGPEPWGPNDRISVELIGSSVWCAGEKEKLKGKCSIKTTLTDKKQGVIRKAGNDFPDFFKNLFVSTMDKENLLKYAKEIGIV